MPPSLFNLRDIGGLPTTSGRTVRRGWLYRSASLHLLEEADLPAFRALNVRTVLDLRGPAEAQGHGFGPADADIRRVSIHLFNPDWPRRHDGDGLTAHRYLADRYAEIANGARQTMPTIIDELSVTSNAPLLIHCAAGKDRTGVVIAVILALLGVPDDPICTDYALTSAAVDRLRAWRARDAPGVAAIVAHEAGQPIAPPEAMALFLTELRQRYGSIEGYARYLRLDDDQLHRLRTAALR